MNIFTYLERFLSVYTHYTYEIRGSSIQQLERKTENIAKTTSLFAFGTIEN